jgi:pimeloyl-ACP methyl ester carboxylesterase
MGGIVALAHLSRFKNPGIGRLVAIGSQFTMPQGEVPAQFAREMLATRQNQVAGALRGPDLIAQSQTGVHNLFFNEKNVLPKVYQALTTDATDIPSIGLMEQYLVLAERGVLLDARRQFPYASGLPNVRIPVFLGCGASDRFAPPSVQKFLYDHIGSTDKTVVVFGRARGFAADAGHNDALVGLNSREQVYPVIARWLAAPH